MLTPKVGILKDMYNQLRKYCIAEKYDLQNWCYSHALFEQGKYSDFEDRGFINLGDHWKTGYDEAHFFKTEFTVPETMANKELRLEFNIGGETLVKVNGMFCGSVSSLESAPERGTIVINEKYNAGEVLKIELEAAVNSMEFCDPAMDGAKDIEYTFSTAYVFVIDEECDGYWYDLEVAFQALPNIQDEHIYSRVYKAVDDSLHIVDYDFSEQEVRKSIYEARKLYNKMISEISWSPNSKVIFTGHSHIDVAWLWRIQESIRKSARTFSNVVSLMDKYPKMTFGQSQAVLYDMVKKHYPELYTKIKEKIANGQWDICGNVWVEADTNLASGESLIRQILYGTEYFKKEFGKVSKTYWLPDCFGFTWALPQIIKRSGMTNFITAKLSYNDTNKFPFQMFRWQGNDGSQVMAHAMNLAYNSCFDVDYLMTADKSANNKEQISTSMGMFGYGDGGGGPTTWMLERSERLQNFPGLPKAEIGHVDDFFEEIAEKKEELPVWNGEMYYENHRGTFTSQAFVKKNNRKGEYALERNEMLSVIAEHFGIGKYDREKSETAWKLLLTNQFHDILPGSSIHEVFEDCKNEYALLRKINGELKETLLSAINSNVETNTESIVCWNLLSCENSFPISLEVKNNTLVPLGKNKKPLPHTFEKTENGYILTFTPDEPIPMFSCKVFELCEAELNSDIVIAEKTLLENSKLKVVLDENGIIVSIYDKINNREVLEGKGNLLTVALDKCIHETAWNLELNYKKKVWELNEAQSIEVSESNSQRGVIEIVRIYNKSKISQKIILNRDSDVLVFENEVDWHETDKVLKAEFNVAVIDTEATYNIAHGAIKRPTHWNTSFDYTRFEVAAHKWADLSEGGYGVTLLNDCKYGYDIHNSRMRITLMRAPTCPDRTGDHGINTFTYALYPHKNSWQDAETVKNGLCLNVPVIASVVSKQEGKIKDGFGILNIDSDNFSIDCIKPAQDGRGVIVRFSEEEHRRGNAKVTWNLSGKTVTECNMIEEDETPIDFNGEFFQFSYKPYEVKTFRIW